MKKIILLITGFICSIIGYTQPGKLDSTFGTNGIVTVPAGVTASAIQSDGKIVVVGNSSMSRYNIDGSLDNTFGINGVRTTSFLIVSIAIQDNDKIVIAGNTPPASGVYTSDLFVARFNSDGTPDNTFNGNGQQTTQFSPNDYEAAICVIIQKDEKIVLTCQVIGNTLAIIRYNSDGSLDDTFDGDGKLNTNIQITGGSGPKSALIQPDGKIILTTSINYNIAVLRFNTDGSPDSTFDGDGLKTIDVGNFGVAIAIQQDGKIVVSGILYYPDETGDGCFARLNADGSLDNSLSGDGKQIVHFGGYVDEAHSVAVADDGQILIGGWSYQNGYYFALTSYSSDGILNTAFGLNGITLTPINASDAYGFISDLVLSGNNLYGVHYPSAVARYTLLNEPYAIITSPVNNSVFNGPATIDIAVQANHPDAAITKVEFYNGSNLLHTDDTSPYTYSWTNVPIGNYALTSKAFDSNGDSITSQQVHVSVVKTQPPTISFESPSDNASYYAPATIPLSALAEDAHAGGAISKVEFFNGNTLLATITNSPYTFSWNNVPEGDYTLKAKATDNTNLTDSELVHIHITKSFVCSGTICATANEGGNLILTAPPGALISSIAFASYGNPNGSCGNFSPGDCNALNSKSVVEGYALNKNSVTIPATNYVFGGDPCNGTAKWLFVEAVWTFLNTATVYLDNDGDGYGNAAVSLSVSNCDSPSGYVHDSTDCDDNNVAINPGVGEITGDGVDNNCNGITDEVICTGTICATANEGGNLVLTAPPGALISSITFASYGTPRGSCGNFSVGGCDSRISKSVVESYALNKNSVIIPVTNQIFGEPCFSTAKWLYVEAVWTAKNTQPVLITSPVNGGTYFNAEITLTGNVCNSTVESVDFYNGNILILTAPAPSFSGKWLNAPAGNYSIIAKSKDRNGNVIGTSQPVNISVVIDPLPAVKITTPTDGTIYAENTALRITAEASDRDGTISKVEFYRGKILLHTEYAFPYDYLWHGLPQGSYTLTARATDNDGHVTISSPVHIYLVPDIAPTVNITSPANGASHTAYSNITLSANASDSDGTVKKVDFYNGGTLIFTETVAPYERKGYRLPTGNYFITAKATDNYGRTTTSQPVAISVVPNNAPVVSITSPVNNTTYVSPATIILSADASDVDGTIKKVDFYNGSTLLFTENDAPYFRSWPDVPEGNYSITAVATDGGGKTTTSAPVAFSVIAASRSLAKEDKLNSSKEPLSLILNPNPAASILNISVHGLQTNSRSTISVLSVSGAVIKTIQPGALNKNLQLDVSSLSGGVYFIKVVNGDKILYKQFVKL